MSELQKCQNKLRIDPNMGHETYNAKPTPGNSSCYLQMGYPLHGSHLLPSYKPPFSCRYYLRSILWPSQLHTHVHSVLGQAGHAIAKQRAQGIPHQAVIHSASPSATRQKDRCMHAKPAALLQPASCNPLLSITKSRSKIVNEA